MHYKAYIGDGLRAEFCLRGATDATGRNLLARVWMQG